MAIVNKEYRQGYFAGAESALRSPAAARDCLTARRILGDNPDSIQ